MTKHEGYQCDGGCGTSLVLDPMDSTTKHGWYRTYTPHPLPTFDTCSAICLARVLERNGLTQSLTLNPDVPSGNQEKHRG